jgi:outer membrane protein OmpA-like peptidoglycan-associated protein
MSTLAAHGRKATDIRPESRRFGRIPAVAGAFALAAAALPALAPDAAAQSRSGIYVNNDVLNSLGPGPEAAPLTPLAPAAAPTLRSPAAQGGYQAPPVAPSGGQGGLSFQPYGSGNFVVTRPGTLLFPPLQDPTSTLTPGFAGAPDNHAARARALDNAFAEGPEPSSQLLIPLQAPAGGPGQGPAASSDSVIVFMDNLPPADPDADHSSAPVLVLQAPPQPAPRKPAVPAEALAGLQPVISEEPAELAPEFTAPQSEVPAPPMMAELPPEAAVEQSPLAAELAAAEPAASETPAAEMPAAELPAAAPTVDETPAPMPAEAAAATTPAPTTSGPMLSEASAPVSLLPAAADSPAGLQTASLTVGGIEDRSFLFDVDSVELSPDVQSELRSLADALRGDGSDIQVLGFASGQDVSEDQARKLALSRALKVRSFHIDAGIPSARIRVRSLGDRAEGGPANRVDIKPIGS